MYMQGEAKLFGDQLWRLFITQAVSGFFIPLLFWSVSIKNMQIVGV